MVATVAINRKESLAMRSFKKLLKDESGATAIEYGLIAALALQLMGTSLRNIFGIVSGELEKAASGAQSSS